jgi:hypothetical protein
VNNKHPELASPAVHLTLHADADIPFRSRNDNGPMILALAILALFIGKKPESEGIIMDCFDGPLQKLGYVHQTVDRKAVLKEFEVIRHCNDAKQFSMSEMDTQENIDKQ